MKLKAASSSFLSLSRILIKISLANFLETCQLLIEILVFTFQGLGSPVFDKLEAEFAKAIMSLLATKGFEFGNGFAGWFLSKHT